MVKYYVGERLVDDDEGMPILQEDGTEICIDSKEFEYLGMPGADAMNWKPSDEEGDT